MTIDVNTEILTKTDVFGVLIYSLLAHLEQGAFGCRITQVEIAETLHMAKSTVSQRIKELNTLNLIEYNKRYKRYIITGKS